MYKHEGKQSSKLSLVLCKYSRRGLTFPLKWAVSMGTARSVLAPISCTRQVDKGTSWVENMLIEVSERTKEVAHMI